MKRNSRNIPVEPDLPEQEAQEPTRPVIQPIHPVLLAVAEYFDRHELTYSIMAHDNSLVFSTANKAFIWPTTVNVFDDRKLLRFAARLPLFVPPARRREVASLISRLNCGALIGCWQMDPTKGEVAFVATHLFGGNIPDDNPIHTLNQVTCALVDNEGPQILRLIQKSPGRRLQLPPPGSN